MLASNPFNNRPERLPPQAVLQEEERRLVTTQGELASAILELQLAQSLCEQGLAIDAPLIQVSHSPGSPIGLN